MYKDKLRIAQIASVAVKVPPKKYGGTERVINALTEGLVKRGHDVTLFATGDSHTSARLVSIYPKSLVEAKIENAFGANILSLLNIGYAYERQEEFDIIHDHSQYLSLPTANLSTKPVVMTLHGQIGIEEKRIYENLRKPYLVTISKAQRKPAPSLNYAANIHHGLDMKDYPFSKKGDNYLLYVGRISYEKGLHHAIEVARYLNMKLIIAAKLNSIKDSPLDVQYFHEFVEPKLSEQIKWIGEVDEKQRNQLMSKALCLLHPVIWPEPFGLTMIEAMACGCPVIAFDFGSISEVIENGKTGFVVESIPQMVYAVYSLNKIDRTYTRNYALKKFNADRMTDEYEKLYHEIIAKERIETKEEIPTLEDVKLPPSISRESIMPIYAHDIRIKD